MNSSLRSVVCGLSLVACAAHARLGPSEALPTGPWGGERAVLEVRQGGADIEFECAAGAVTAPFILAEGGAFDLPGTFRPQRPGPERDTDPAASAARYQGDVRGDTMTLTVVRGSDKWGPYTLTRGARPALRKCR